MNEFPDVVYGEEDDWVTDMFRRHIRGTGSRARPYRNVTEPHDAERELIGARLLAEAQLKRLAALEAEIAATPEEPAEGSVVRFNRKFANSDKVYTYAGVRVGNKWYLSGSVGSHRDVVTWGQLVVLANVGKIKLATGYRKLRPRGE